MVAGDSPVVADDIPVDAAITEPKLIYEYMEI
jgi:hypothetical protein